MIKLSSDGASLLFEFTEHQHYLYGNGEITVPLNSLTVIFDESDMVTFRKAPSNDIFLSANIDEIEGFDKDSLKQWLQENAYGTAVKDGMSIKVVDELPTVGSEKFIYLKESDDHSGYGMWVYTDETGWVLSSSLNATSYVGKDAITIQKLQPTDTATTVSLKIADADKFLAQSTSGLSSNIDLKYEKESGGTDESGQTIYNHYLRLYGKDSGTPVTSIDINDLYKDNYLVSATYNDAKQALVLTFKIDNHYQTVEVPIPTAYKGKEAIKIEKASGDSAFTVSLVVDNTSVSGLTQSNSGIKLVADNAINSASTNVVQNKALYEALDAIHIVSGETQNGKTYKLNVLGVDKAETINVPNGSNATALTVDDASQSIKLDIKNADGTTSTLSGDATNVIFESDVNNGLEVNAHKVNVKIDATSDSGLTVSSGGIKFNADATIDSASTNAIENKAVYDALEGINIASAETPDGKTYTLNVNGKAKQNVINVPNGSNVTGLTIDNQNQQILLDVKQADGTVTQLSGDATNVIFESDVNNGLEVNAHNLKIKLATGEKILTVDANGLKDNATLSAYTDANDADHIVLSGHSEIVSDVKIGAYSGVSAISIDDKEVKLNIKSGDKVLKQDANSLSSEISLSAETSIAGGVVAHTTFLKGLEGTEIASATTKLKGGDNISLSLSADTIEISGKNYTVIESLTGTGKADVLYLYKQTDATTSAVTYTQYAYVDGAWVQVSSKGVEYVAGKNIDIYEDATTHKQTISGSQVVELTQAEYDALATKDPDKLYVITDAPSLLTYVNALPASGVTDVFYLLRKSYASGGTYDELYTYKDNAFVPVDNDESGVILDAGSY